ncbi:MAG: methyl-accepting chemotaxis protein, partial [Treponema sp.]|nr:methyl-accepting chemotaxis protein [Treponema sp.]
MIFNDMKITTKLTISSVAFLVPIAVMLYLVISVSNTSIQSAKNELRGIASLRPVVELLRLIPRHLEIAVDRGAEGAFVLNGEIEQQF